MPSKATLLSLGRAEKILAWNPRELLPVSVDNNELDKQVG